MSLEEKRMAAMREAAKVVFGFDQLRPFQGEVLTPLCRKQDTLAITATGGGKSLCFQLPAMVLPGPAVVVSPLISLMKDQVDKLRAFGVKACRMSSDLPRSEVVPVEALPEQDLIYVSPEKLAQPGFQKALRAVKLSMVALDEAHVAVTWGRDFRSSYAHLSTFVDQHPEAVRFACTATADAEVEEGIVALMGLRSHARVVTSPWRDNIQYVVRREAGFSELVDLVEKAQAQPGSQIVYVSKRDEASEVADRLRVAKLDASHYHAGMNPNIRTQVQERFMRGDLRCVVATNAFGMGVDKPDIRLVAHWNMPGSLFNYLQETGRASRDGQPATAWLNMSKDALKTQEFFIQVANPRFESYQRMWNFLSNAGRSPVRVPLAVLGRAAGIHMERMRGQAQAALSFLEYTGHVRVQTIGLAYELPIVNAAVAANVTRSIRGARLGRGVVHYEPAEGDADMHMRLVTSGACRYEDPTDVLQVAMLRRDLTLTEDQVLAKLAGARQRVMLLQRFADATDRKAFVEALFASRGAVP